MKYLVTIVFLLGFGCSESVDDPPGVDSGTDTGVDTGIDTGVDSSSPDTGSDSAMDDAAMPPRSLVINEVQASGDDWIEVKNVGTEPLDVGGWVVTQADDMGAPEPARSTPFPDGYVIPAGGYFIVLAGLVTTDGIETDCVVPGVTMCLHAEFGVSNGSGDTLVVVDDSGTVVDMMVYPPDAAGAEDTYARLPDGTGDFGVAVPTPLASNMAR